VVVSRRVYNVVSGTRFGVCCLRSGCVSAGASFQGTWLKGPFPSIITRLSRLRCGTATPTTSLGPSLRASPN